MKITDGAKQLLENVLGENAAEGIRFFTVVGCCGPQFALSLNAPLESDSVQVINGIKVAIDSQITSTEELTIDKDGQGEGFVLIGASSCC